jgi:hypothetical protein
MKKLLLLFIAFSTVTVMAADILDLDPNEIEDLEYCSRKLKNMSYQQVNQLENRSELLDRNGNLNNKLMHNFIFDMYYYDWYSIDGSIVTSATLRFSKKAAITNSVVSNMTFVGDVSNINFKGSCLVNVRFPRETSWRTKRKIKREAFYYKNLEFKNEYAPWK